MAELEDAFDVQSVDKAIAVVTEAPSSRNMATVIHALMLPQDRAAHSIEDIRRWPLTTAEIGSVLSRLGDSARRGDEGNVSPPSKAPPKKSRAA